MFFGSLLSILQKLFLILYHQQINYDIWQIMMITFNGNINSHMNLLIQKESILVIIIFAHLLIQIHNKYYQMPNQFRQQKVLFVCWFVLATILCVEETNQIQKTSKQQIQQEELAIQQEFKNQIGTQLQEWILQQNDWNAQYPQIQTHESFIFKLHVDSQQTFRMKSSPLTTKLISVSVFLAQNNEDITIPQNPDIQSYVQVLTSNTKSGLQQSQGKVYIQKVFQIQFTETYKYIKIVSNLPIDAFIIVNMEQYDFTVNSKVSDDKFYIARSKMQAIKKQIQATQSNREHMFKFQWGFYDKKKRHQQDMLQLTGAELTAIIITSIVQMYCIKNLIGHQLIV